MRVLAGPEPPLFRTGAPRDGANTISQLQSPPPEHPAPCGTTIRGRHFSSHQQEEARMASRKKWSADVTAHSDALDLKEKAFAADKPKDIADSLKESAEQSKRRKAGPFQSAMSMLNFYINRAGKNLSAARRKKLEKAKDELRKDFGRPPK
jgi:hypothetical protein